MPVAGSAGDSTAERIARIARDLLVAEGAGAVSMRRVAAAVGVTPMTIYRHYRDREALLRYVADGAVEELAAQFTRAREGGLEQRMHGMLDDLLDVALRQPHLYAYLFTDPRPDARALPGDVADSPTLRVVAEALTEGMAAGQFRTADVGRVTLGAAGLVEGLIMLRHTGRIDVADDDFRALCHDSVDLLLTGLRR